MKSPNSNVMISLRRMEVGVSSHLFPEIRFIKIRDHSSYLVVIDSLVIW